MWRLAARLPQRPLFAGASAAGLALAALGGRAAEAEEEAGIVVLGGGVMGGSAAWQLARRGQKVTLLDAGEPGSSWGETRISRLAYSDPFYVQFMKRGFQLWEELENETGRQLRRKTPCLDLGDIGSPALNGLAKTYESLGLPYERLSAAEVRRRFPQISPLDSEQAVVQGDAAALLAAECVGALEEAAESRGATWISGEAAVKIDRMRRIVTTDAGRTLRYDKLVLCCGPWTNKVLGSAGLGKLPLVVSNEQNVYYEVDEAYKGAAYSIDGGMPLILRHTPTANPGEKRQGFYVIPDVGGVPGVKLGFHRTGTLLKNDDFQLRPGTTDENIKILPHPVKTFWSERTDDVDEAALKLCDDFVAKRFPGLKRQHTSQLRCLYTCHTLPDEDFLIGRHPQDPAVVVAAGFGGEGFKFGVAVGEVVADLVLGVTTETAKSRRERFRLERAF